MHLDDENVGNSTCNVDVLLMVTVQLTIKRKLIKYIVNKIILYRLTVMPTLGCSSVIQ